jgi:DNA modification methylase
VLDPFAGTGTTLVAAGLEGAHGIGVELDTKYLAIAAARLEEAKGLFDVFSASNEGRIPRADGRVDRLTP